MYDRSGNKCCTIFLSDDPFAGVFYPSESGGGGGGCSYAAAYAYKYVDEANGGFALEESQKPPSARYYGAERQSKIFWYEYDFVSVQEDGICIVDASAGMFQGSFAWLDGGVSVTPFDFFGAELSAGASASKGLYFSALAYTAAATGTIDLGFVEISATGYAGAIGAEFALGLGEATIGIAPNGVGGSISIRWDYE